MQVWARYQRAIADVHYWFADLVHTKDQHDETVLFKKYPWHKEYTHHVVDAIRNEQRLLLPKSRQMVISWTVVAVCLWEALRFNNQLIIMQSKTEGDAAKLLHRARFIYENMGGTDSEWFKLVKSPMLYTTSKGDVKMWFPNGSEILAIPQGANVIRMHTCSRLFLDEVAFMEEFEGAYQAALPSLTGGGKMVAVSTRNGEEYFYRLVHDLS